MGSYKLEELLDFPTVDREQAITYIKLDTEYKKEVLGNHEWRFFPEVKVIHAQRGREEEIIAELVEVIL